jgi:SNF2 family DNA or RNA helicase
VAVAQLDPEAPDKFILLETGWSEQALARQIPGSRWDTTRKRWTIPLTWNACLALQGIIPGVDVQPDLLTWSARERTTRVDACLTLRDLIDWPADWSDPGFNPDLYPYQKVVNYMAILAGRSFIFGDEVACGKGVQVLTTLRLLYQLGQPVLRGIIVCPNSVKRHWSREIPRWFPEAVPYVISGTARQRKDTIALASADPNSIMIVNYEAMRLLSRLAPYGSIKLKRCRDCDRYTGDETLTPARCEVHPKVFNSIPFVTFIVDEAHRLKDPVAKQTRACWAVAHQSSVKRAWAMTGTAIARHVGDLWSILHCVDPAKYPVRSKWLDRYALMSYGTHGGLEVIGLRPDTAAEFYASLYPSYRRMTAALVDEQLPRMIYVPRTVEMPPAQRKRYHELDTKLKTYTEDGQLFIAPNNLVAKTRLMQLAAGNVTIELPPGKNPDDVSDWEVHITEPSPKLDELALIHEELDGEPYVLGGIHKELLYLAAKRYEKQGVRYMMATGDQSEYERDQALQALNAGRIQVLITTISASKEGINFAEAVTTMVKLQRSWSLIEEIQFNGRHAPARRVGEGRLRASRIIDVITEGTCEEAQLVRLAQRREQLEQINRDRLALVKQGRDTTALDVAYQDVLNTDVGTPT